MRGLPPPMTPSDCDLRKFPYLPLDVARLRDSDFAAGADGEVFRAGVLAWCASWHQVPAASLPNDDVILARLLGYGRDIAGWRALREAGALRGFVVCDDGRLYHPVVAEKALAAMESLQQRVKRTEAARKAKEAKRQADQTEMASEDAAARKSASEQIQHLASGQSLSQGAGASVTDLFPVCDSLQQNRTEQNRDSLSLRDKDAPASASPDPKADLFREGKAILTRLTGKPISACGQIIGRMLKINRDDHADALRVLREAEATPRADALAWIMAAAGRAKAASGSGGSAPTEDPDLYGITAWARRVATETGKCAQTGEIVPMIASTDHGGVAEDVLNEALRMGATFTDRPNWDAVIAWCQEGYNADYDRLLGAVRAVASRLREPIRSAAVFDAAIRERCRPRLFA